VESTSYTVTPILSSADAERHYALTTLKRTALASTAADILEIVDSCHALAEAEADLPQAIAQVEDDPANAEKQFRLGLLLSKLDRDEKAVQAYQAALRSRKTMCEATHRDCLNNIATA
jgi:tetratricopeptide (TPR) repeat protein